MSPAVYVQTNDATGNEVIAFSRTGTGALATLGRYSTGGRGTSSPHLASAVRRWIGGYGAGFYVRHAAR